ncbi:quercetin 2,3-dioxygenase [Polynucleobacter sp. MWH-Tro8-2-5-gr]|uniref:pirin family protein n=1 Tax=Polynucleobacter sp. MWH-Tro8-2-5-gr TaxID=1855606 RepID=UPI0008F811EB|nr:pirin family protein [Polynucleobacter sp. MWH-Tro8-2-5-gr]OIN00128.1 quercetin 2,3-dioxygenase [Polynucleobacter sp. MWH-Tro8-2-5-gr]
MIRNIQTVIPGIATSDGAGVKLRRSLGGQQQARLDPFLMLDEFSSNDPNDYVAGFPAHPHRGFETVTYMLEGHMLHEDHLGNQGHLKSGGVQWMTAGRGIIHSEMPQQVSGAMRGFQLWINLPAIEKMKTPGYKDIQVEDIPSTTLANGGSVKAIAGSYVNGDTTVQGPIQGITTAPLFLDVHLPPSGEFEHRIPKELNAFVYIYEGSLEIGSPMRAVPKQAAIVLGDGDLLKAKAGADGAQFIVLAALPLHEPIVQYGPFVMNTRVEIEQAIDDYQNNRFVTT